MSASDKNGQETIDTIASAIEDMIYMGILMLVRRKNEDIEKAAFTANFSGIVSNLIEDRAISYDASPKVITTLMYHSLLIFMSENLRIPKSFAIALGNDLEKYGNEMKCGALIFNYAAILQKIFFESKKEFLR